MTFATATVVVFAAPALIALKLQPAYWSCRMSNTY